MAVGKRSATHGLRAPNNHPTPEGSPEAVVRIRRDRLHLTNLCDPYRVAFGFMSDFGGGAALGTGYHSAGFQPAPGKRPVDPEGVRTRRQSEGTRRLGGADQDRKCLFDKGLRVRLRLAASEPLFLHFLVEIGGMGPVYLDLFGEEP